MKRLLSTINKQRPGAGPSGDAPAYAEDSPESTILKEVNAFCQEGQGPNQPQGEEFVHLPSIVESAESSPNAAREAAHLLRKLLSSPNSTAANIQYNAVMLIRILIDNPGHTFTRNLDAKFTATIKELLRTEKDMGVQQFVRETLDAMESQRQWDEDLKLLIEMWQKEKLKMNKTYTNSKSNRSSTWRRTPSRQNSDVNVVMADRTDSLPQPSELVSRISEAKTSAKLLTQFVQSTPPAEMLSNDLIQEFSGRCRRATRAMQNYIHATNPPPDEDTLLTLIETNDELSVALSKHQRAMLQARKALGQQTPPTESAAQSPSDSDNQYPNANARPVPPPPVPERSRTPPQFEPISPVSPGLAHQPSTARTEVTDISSISGTMGGTAPTGRYEYRSEDYQVQNPFADNYSIPPSMPAHSEESDTDRLDERNRWNGTQQPAQQHQQHT